MDEEAIKKYSQQGGIECLRCGSEDITGDAFSADCGTAWQTVQCDVCGATWNDIYTLTSIEVWPQIRRRE